MDKDARKRVRPTTLVVDLKHLKAPWTAWCAGRSLTPSEAVRRVLAAVLAGNPSADRPPHPADFEKDTGSGRRRVEISMQPAEYLAAAAAADREGMSLSRWLLAHARVHLSGEEPFGKNEVESLARSNQLLLALGRSINQIAYNMNQQVDQDALTLAHIELVSTFLKAHTQAVAELLQANRKRWRR